MPVRLHELTSFWLYADSWNCDEPGRVRISATDKDKAGPADAWDLDLPAEGYTSTLLFTDEPVQGRVAPLPTCLLLKPLNLGSGYLVFGTAPALREFADLFGF